MTTKQVVAASGDQNEPHAVYNIIQAEIRSHSMAREKNAVFV
jgi:hypothetical protein